MDRMLAEAESLPAVLAEVRVPKGYSPPTPGAIQVTLTSLDGIGDPIQSDPYWPPTVQDILCEQAAGNDRFDAYRKIYRQAGIQFELAPIDIRMFRKDELLEYVDSPANIQLLRGLRNGEPANPPGTQNLTIVFTATVNGQPNGLTYPGDHVAVLGSTCDWRNQRHFAHELAHLLGEPQDLSGVKNRLNLMLNDADTLSNTEIDVGNELQPDQIRRVRTTLPGGFLR